ncbi:MAG: hypothetical protein IPH28_16725 [Cytophagaceae bacterium]|nr:hypothetical protein [Cytophagaceae bacterium]
MATFTFAEASNFEFEKTELPKVRLIIFDFAKSFASSASRSNLVCSSNSIACKSAGSIVISLVLVVALVGVLFIGVVLLFVACFSCVFLVVGVFVVGIGLF